MNEQEPKNEMAEATKALADMNDRLERATQDLATDSTERRVERQPAEGLWICKSNGFTYLGRLASLHENGDPTGADHVVLAPAYELRVTVQAEVNQRTGAQRMRVVRQVLPIMLYPTLETATLERPDVWPCTDLLPEEQRELLGLILEAEDTRKQLRGSTTGLHLAGPGDMPKGPPPQAAPGR